jgi:hypothetical protein
MTLCVRTARPSAIPAISPTYFIRKNLRDQQEEINKDTMRELFMLQKGLVALIA